MLASLSRMLPSALGAASATRRGDIGLQFGLHRWRMMQLVREPVGMRVAAFSSIAYPESREALLADRPALRKEIARVMRAQGFRGRKVSSCLTPDQVRITMLHYSVSNQQQDAEVILERMSSRMEGPVAEHVIDYVPVRNEVADGQERAALVAVARREDVINYLDLLNDLGLQADALEIGPTAIRRLVASWQQQIDDNVLIITMGQDATYMTVLSGRRLIFDREAHFGERPLIDRLCNELDIDERGAHSLLDRRGLRMDDHRSSAHSYLEDEGAGTVFEVLKPLFMELVEDINKALIYTASSTRGRSIGHIYLNGAVARWKGVPGLLSQMLSVPVSVIDPVQGMKVSQHDFASDPRAAIVTGLALRGLIDDV